MYGVPKNRPTCENYIADDKNFPGASTKFQDVPVFPGAISNSRRFS